MPRGARADRARRSSSRAGARERRFERARRPSTSRSCAAISATSIRSSARSPDATRFIMSPPTTGCGSPIPRRCMRPTSRARSMFCELRRRRASCASFIPAPWRAWDSAQRSRARGHAVVARGDDGALQAFEVHGRASGVGSRARGRAGGDRESVDADWRASTSSRRRREE